MVTAPINKYQMIMIFLLTIGIQTATPAGGPTPPPPVPPPGFPIDSNIFILVLTALVLGGITIRKKIKSSL